MANSVDRDQTAFMGTWSTLFATIFNSSVMLGNLLQQTTSAEVIVRRIFWLENYNNHCSLKQWLLMGG